jgi:hypothetical protein
MSSLSFLPLKWSLSAEYRAIEVFGIADEGSVFIRTGVMPYFYIQRPYDISTIIHHAPISDIVETEDGAKIFCTSRGNLEKARHLLRKIGIPVHDEADQLAKYLVDRKILPGKMVMAKGLNALPEYQLFGKKVHHFEHEFSADTLVPDLKSPYPSAKVPLILRYRDNHGDSDSNGESVDKYFSSEMTFLPNRIDLSPLVEWLPGSRKFAYPKRRAFFLVSSHFPSLRSSHSPSHLPEEIPPCGVEIDFMSAISFIDPYLSMTPNNISLRFTGLGARNIFDALLNVVREGRFLDLLRQLGDFWYCDITSFAGISKEHSPMDLIRQHVRSLATFFLTTLPSHAPKHPFPLVLRKGSVTYPRAINLDPWWQKAFLNENPSSRSLITYFQQYPLSDPCLHYLWMAGLFQSTPIDLLNLDDYYALTPQYAFGDEVNGVNKRGKQETKSFSLLLGQSTGLLLLHDRVKYLYGYSPLFYPVSPFIEKALSQYIDDLLRGEKDPLADGKWFSRLDLILSDYLCSIFIDESDFDHLGGRLLPPLSPNKGLKRELATRLLAYGKGKTFLQGKGGNISFLYTLVHGKPSLILESEIIHGQKPDYDRYSDLLQEAFRDL